MPAAIVTSSSTSVKPCSCRTRRTTALIILLNTGHPLSSNPS